MLPYLNDAYTLARYLTRDDHDAEDVVQDAFLRAFMYRDSFRGEGSSSAKAWLLTIVRNTAFSWRRKIRPAQSATEFDETVHSDSVAGHHPESSMLQQDARETITAALDQLPAEFREVIILREVEGLSYQEISEVAGVPVGTVMSRLSRARNRLQRILRPETGED